MWFYFWVTWVTTWKPRPARMRDISVLAVHPRRTGVQGAPATIWKSGRQVSVLLWPCIFSVVCFVFQKNEQDQRKEICSSLPFVSRWGAFFGGGARGGRIDYRAEPSTARAAWAAGWRNLQPELGGSVRRFGWRCGKGSRLSRMERLMEQLLQWDLLREQQQTRQGSSGTPAVSFTALAIASPSIEGSIGDQVWAGQEEGSLAENFEILKIKSAIYPIR